MLDFLKVSYRSTKKDNIEIYPKFRVDRNKDLMVRGGDFYAIYIEEEGLWSTSEFDAIRLIDAELDKFYEQEKQKFNGNVKILYLWDSESGMIDSFHKYCQRQLRDNYHPLDENITFLDQKTTREDYASKRLAYPLIEGPTPSWDKLVSTLYDPEEQNKIEWAIGSIVAGASVDLQKFFVFYGSAGTGKSTMLDIIDMLFENYVATFSSKNLGNSNSTFALESFRDNPLVAIDHEGDLSKIDDNTKLNALVSHDKLTVNEKFKSTYVNRFRCLLFIGSNNPVRITDSRSGLLRRLIDIHPSGRLLKKEEYDRCMNQIKYELSGIAEKCRKVYITDPKLYDSYVPRKMLRATNDFFGYMVDLYLLYGEKDEVPLNVAWKSYNKFCDDANISRKFTRTQFVNEFEQYFYHRDVINREDPTIGVTYRGFKKNKLEVNDGHMRIPDEPEEVKDLWLTFQEQPSEFDKEFPDAPAQYTEEKNGNIKPITSWSKCKTTLKDIDTHKLHYVKVPENHIVIDLDIPNENGEKDFERNYKAALEFPPTYAELSKSGGGIHLHYFYEGDVNELLRKYDDHIEIKVFTGLSSLRRMLTMCNNMPILTLSTGLPVKKKEEELVDKVVNKEVVLSEKRMRETITNVINKNYTNIGGTKPGIDFIKHILDEQYARGAHFDLSDMKPRVINFAMKSTHNAGYCLDVVNQMKFMSEDAAEPYVDYDDKDIVFFDIEVFPNLLVICWKVEGEGKPVHKMINPSPEEVRKLFDMKLVGFNNRNYDNHIVYARGQDYTIPMLYGLSQKIISGDDNGAKFREAYNLSFTDIYDFASAGNKKGLKKLEIEMSHRTAKDLKEDKFTDYQIKMIKAGDHHQELGIPWDQPVDESLWEKVADYCVNDVVATEAAWNYLASDFSAREALADIAGGNVNQTTNTLSQMFIFEDNRHPQDEFCYRDMSKPITEMDIEVIKFLEEACPEMMAEPHGKDGSILPYFPGYEYKNGKSTYRGCDVGEGGYVYSEPGLHCNVALLDVASMHPHSTIAECLFGPKYTRRFRDIVETRVYIKHKDWNNVVIMLDGKLAPYVEKIQNGEISSKALANALKTVINSVYGLTAASFANRFRDERNRDNIVAKRGALFMIDLKNEVQQRGFTVAHIKTDSIKIADATPEIIQFVMDFGKRYAYTFEFEAVYERMVLVNKAVYIAKFATPEHCEKFFNYIPNENAEDGGKWTATGDEFKIPYIFKSMFSKEKIEFKDLTRTFQVQQGSLYLDMNEGLANVEEAEKEIKKLEQKYKKGELSDTIFEKECAKYKEEIEAGHDYRFVGKVGSFVPVKSGVNGGVLYRIKDGVKAAATGSIGYRWKETEVVQGNNLQDQIDMSFWDDKVAESIDHISKHCDYEWFVSEDPYPGCEYVVDGDFDGWRHPVYNKEEKEELPWAI